MPDLDIYISVRPHMANDPCSSKHWSIFTIPRDSDRHDQATRFTFYDIVSTANAGYKLVIVPDMPRVSAGLLDNVGKLATVLGSSFALYNAVVSVRPQKSEDWIFKVLRELDGLVELDHFEVRRMKGFRDPKPRLMRLWAEVLREVREYELRRAVRR